MPRRLCLSVVLLSTAWLGRSEASHDLWPEVTQTARPWTRWWWPGSAVDERNLDRSLAEFARAGLGGVEITPIYGVRGYEDRNVPFLSERWMQLLRHTIDSGQRHGVGVDMATGTGWPFGAPWVPASDASHKIALRDGRLEGVPTAMKVKRAAPGGEGLVLDPYSPSALSRYLARFDEAFAGTGARSAKPRAQFHDSFEYYNAEWTPELTSVFRQMHGYDLQEFAAQFMGAAPMEPDRLARLKGDYRATLAELHLRYLQTWTGWSHHHGSLVRNQSHGAPANLLDLYGAVDIPETETFGFTPFPIPGLRREWTSRRDIPESLVLRMASSAAHVMGRPLVSSESCTWLREHWHDALAFTKPEIDRLFVEGINHVFYHGTVYSPADAEWPGWLFYASTQFNPNNTWWEDFAQLNAYVTRVQSILQSGKPDNHVLVYWPFHDLLHDAKGTMLQFGVHNPHWATDSSFGRLANELYAAGYHYDAISDAQLQHIRFTDNALTTPGARYRVIVVPATKHLPLETLGKLAELQEQGAQVVFESPPTDVPGLGRLEARRARLRELVAMLGAGKTTSASASVIEKLRTLNVPRDPAADSKLRFIRRASEHGHDYFFANLGASPVDGWVGIAAHAPSAYVLDPLTGEASRAAVRRHEGDTQVYLQLKPGESRIVRTRRGDSHPDVGMAYFRPAGAAQQLGGTWKIHFPKGGPVLPAALQTPELRSWTELGDDLELQRFGGTARYRIEFDHPAGPADDWLLDLGDVRESAVVRLNGREIGAAWSIPFHVRLKGSLQPGRNTLEIDVTNTAANRIRDLDRRKVDWKIMREINFVDLEYRPFDASTWPVSDSGLLGPVKLIPLKAFVPN